ncbi:non-canonical purine NTP pyrophosphatase [Candidatus Microgenomates bacterium]|nr:non-canonical purine NTP pyrophosphatase [Candidatus Microgenomates bacterium]
MKKILIATTNPGKFFEIKEFLSDLPILPVSLNELKITQRAREDFPTFRKNSQHKAKFYSEISGLPAIADDGGLEIAYLHGAPGVFSRRWMNGSEDVSDQELIEFTLYKMKGVPVNKRGAQLRTVISLALPDGIVYSASAKVRGIIAEKPYYILIPGFPYRSLLYLPEIDKFYHSQEMTQKETEKYNHRKKALEKLKKIIRKQFID